MKNIGAAVLLIFIGLGFEARTVLGQSADPQISQAFATFNKGDLQGAMKIVNEVLKAGSDNTNAYFLRGLIFAGLNDYDAAIADETKAIELSPTVASIYYQRSSMYYKYYSRSHDNVMKFALPDANQAIKLKGDYKEAYLLRAEINSDQALLTNEQAAWKASETDYTSAIKYGANDQHVYQARGYARLMLKNYAESAADSYKALTFPASDATSYILRNLEEAKRLQAEADRPNKDKGRELADRAGKESAAADYDHAISDATAAIALDPNNSYAYSIRGVAYISSGRYEAAIADETKVLELSPDNVIAYFNRAVANQHLNRAEATIDDFQKVIDLDSGDTSSKATESLRAYVNSLEDQAVVDLINPRLVKVKASLLLFVKNAAKQANVANSNPTQAAVCGSLTDLEPFFRDYKAGLHRLFFVRLVDPSAKIESLAAVVEENRKAEAHLLSDEKTMNDQKTQFKCKP